MPTIDWNYYKKNVRKDYVKWVSEFQKKYDGVDTMFANRYTMIEPSKYFGDVEKQTEEVQKEVCKYKEESDKRIEELERKIKHLKNVKDYNHMTMEEFCFAHPEEAPDFRNKPTFWPHTPDEQKPGPIEEHAHDGDEESDEGKGKDPPKGAKPDPGKAPPAPGSGGAPPAAKPAAAAAAAKAEPPPPAKKEDPKPSQLAETVSALSSQGIALATALATKAIVILKGLIEQARNKQKPAKALPTPVHNEKFSKLEKSEDICSKTLIRGEDTAKADVKEHHTDLTTEGESDEGESKPKTKCAESKPEPNCETDKPKCGDQEEKSKSPCDRYLNKNKSNKCEPTSSSCPDLAPGTLEAPKTIGTPEQQQQTQTPPSVRPLAADYNQPIMKTSEFELTNDKQVLADAKASPIQSVKESTAAVAQPTGQPATTAKQTQPEKKVVPAAKASIIKPVKETTAAVAQPDTKAADCQPSMEVLPEAKAGVIQPAQVTTAAVDTKEKYSQPLLETATATAAQPKETAVEKTMPTNVASNMIVRSKKEEGDPKKNETKATDSKQDDKEAGALSEQTSATEMAKAMFDKAIGAANSLSEAKRIIEKAQRENAGDLKALASAYAKAQKEVKYALSKSYAALKSARTLSEQAKKSSSNQDSKVIEMIDKHAVLAKMLASRAITMDKAIVKVLTEIKKMI